MRDLGERSFAFFAAYFFPEYIQSDLPGFLRELCDELQRSEDLIAILPRGHSKSTVVSLVYILWCVYYQKYHFIVLFSETDDQAKTLLFAIREEITKNERLRAVFGDILEGEPSEKKIVTSTGICIRSAGRGSSTRGWRFKHYRPQLIIADDLENDETVQTQHQRDKVERWFNSSIIPMRDRGASRLLIIGTTLHQDALLLRKVKTGAFRIFRRQSVITEPTRKDLWDVWDQTWNAEGKESARAYYDANHRVMDAGARTLWPGRFPYIALAEIRKTIGPFSFQTEYQNDPVPAESVIIKQEWVADRPRFVDGEHPHIIDGQQIIPVSDLTTFGSVDVAISTKARADYSVLATGGRSKDGHIYIFDIVRTRVNAPELLKLITATFTKWKHTKIAIESVAYQAAIKQLLDLDSAASGLYIPTVEVHPDSDKVRRLIRWQPQFEQRLVKLCDSVPSSSVDELTQFPLAEHDDVVDAISQLLDLIHDSRSARIFVL